MNKARRRLKRLIAPLGVTVLAGALIGVGIQQASAADSLLSQGRPSLASSTENGAPPAAAAFDGDNGTRWGSLWADPQWVRVDLGATATITRVDLSWEAAYAKSFQIQTSPDGNDPWTSIYSTTTSTGGNQSLPVNGSGR